MKNIDHIILTNNMNFIGDMKTQTCCSNMSTFVKPGIWFRTIPEL